MKRFSVAILLALFLTSSSAYADWASFWKKDNAGKKSEAKKTVATDKKRKAKPLRKTAMKEAQESSEGSEGEAGGEGLGGDINEIPRVPDPIVRAPENPNRTLQGIYRPQANTTAATNIRIERAPQNPASMTPPRPQTTPEAAAPK